jgi:hypothetical protein
MSARFERDSGEKRSGRLPAGPAHGRRGLVALKHRFDHHHK